MNMHKLSFLAILLLPMTSGLSNDLGVQDKLHGAVLGQSFGAKHAHALILGQEVENLHPDNVGLFATGTYAKELDRRNRKVQRTTSYCGGSLGREWALDSKKVHTRYGAMLNYTKRKNDFSIKYIEHGSN